MHMAITQNTADNVSALSGVVGGYFFVAQEGTTLPTDADTELGSGFSNLGFVTSDGITVDDTETTETTKDLNNSSVDDTVTDEDHTLKLTLLEYFRPEALKAIYGDGNVTVKPDGSIVVNHTSGNRKRCVFVGEFLRNDGSKYRMVVPSGKVVEVGSLTIAKGAKAMREMTIRAYRTSSAPAIVDYIGKAGE